MAFLGIAILAVLGLLLLVGWLQGSIVCAAILLVPSAYLVVMLAGMSGPHAAQVGLVVVVIAAAAPRVLLELDRATGRRRHVRDAPFISPTWRRP